MVANGGRYDVSGNLVRSVFVRGDVHAGNGLAVPPTSGCEKAKRSIEWTRLALVRFRENTSDETGGIRIRPIGMSRLQIGTDLPAGIFRRHSLAFQRKRP